ncbi:MAG: ureidoglycolate lyase [Litoreibacter sp.]|uniref:ureidoglycolate lyase n=1 Tax=Litoreibacter sp. TaxID=1969459 RepID=UPI003298782C
MVIRTQPLTVKAFAPYGDVLDCAGSPDKLINEGMCSRFHDRAELDFEDGRAGVSIFHAVPRALPYDLTLLERHPLGSQTFIPMSFDPFLVIVAQDLGNKPGKVTAFLSAPGQAINFHKGTWHGVLTPLAAPGLFAVVDRIGDGANLEEFRLDKPVMIERG